MTSKKQLQQRRSVIINELTKMSYDNWRRSRTSDYWPLEAELREINDNLNTRAAKRQKLRGEP